MPGQMRQTASPVTNRISFIKKPETVPRKFYGTPLCSPVERAPSDNIIVVGKPLVSASPRHPKYPDDSSDDEDAILTECIRSAMPKVINPEEREVLFAHFLSRKTWNVVHVASCFQARFNASPMRSSPMPQTVDGPKAMNVRMFTPASSVLCMPSAYVQQRRPAAKQYLPFEGNAELSDDEEDIILAQCIKSGMPKVSCAGDVLDLRDKHGRL